MIEYFVGDIGKVISIDANALWGTDLTNFTTHTLRVKRGDDTVISPDITTAVFNSPRNLTYATKSGDLTVKGTYIIQWIATGPGTLNMVVEEITIIVKERV